MTASSLLLSNYWTPSMYDMPFPKPSYVKPAVILSIGSQFTWISAHSGTIASHGQTSGVYRCALQIWVIYVGHFRSPNLGINKRPVVCTLSVSCTCYKQMWNFCIFQLAVRYVLHSGGCHVPESKWSFSALSQEEQSSGSFLGRKLPLHQAVGKK